MRFVFHQVILTTQLLRGFFGQPTLQPGTDYYCPNETVTLNCHDSEIVVIEWIVDGYIPKGLFQYAATDVLLGESLQANNFTAILTNITVNGSVANMITSLTVDTCGLNNGTNITCSTYKTSGSRSEYSSSFIYFPDVPYLKDMLIIYQENETYFTAVLELGDMFDGGGVPIDHYIIQVGNNTQLETPGPTYSVDVMYNETLTVNISAHNYSQGSSSTMQPTILGPSTLPTSEPSPSPELSIFVHLSIGIVVIILSILVILSLLLYKLHQKCTKSRCKGYVISEPNTTRTGHNENELMEIHHVNSTSSQNYSYVPVSKRDCTGQYSTVVHSENPTTSHTNNVSALYTEVGSHTQPTTQPSFTVDDTALYSLPIDAIAGPAQMPKSKKRKRKVQPQPIPPQAPPPAANDREHLPDTVETDTPPDEDTHPLDKNINAHLILLQLVPVRPFWRAMGSAAGLTEETLDLINADLSEDGDRLAEVVFTWLEQKSRVRWIDVASLCEMTGFNYISEGISRAYTTGVLPVEDDARISPTEQDQAETPAIPPRSHRPGSEISPQPPPLPPPLSLDDI